MDEFGAAEVGALFGAAGAVLVLVADRRSILLAGLAALVAAEGLLIPRDRVGAAIGDRSGGLLSSRQEPGFVRTRPSSHPWSSASPRFVPPSSSTQNRFFVALAQDGDLGRLLPLYAVLGAASLALAWRSLRGEPVRPAAPSRSRQRRSSASPASRCFGRRAERPGTDLLAFFLLPFAVLLATVGRAPFPAWMPKALAAVAVGLASVFAVIGLIEASTGRLLFGSPAWTSRILRSFFRVTSLFRDPSIYGRHLVLALVVLVTAMLLASSTCRVGGALVALLAAALFFTYSQSSMVALFVAVLALLIAVTPTRLRALRRLGGRARRGHRGGGGLGGARRVDAPCDERPLHPDRGCRPRDRRHAGGRAGIGGQPAAAVGSRSARPDIRRSSRTRPR